MGIFSRFRDIISSNINAMLDKAEDPEKLIKLMIQEMEDTLVEIKASCAGTMASRTRVLRTLEEGKRHAVNWARKARRAIEKEREDLAREALFEKRHFQEEVESLEKEARQFSEIIERFQSDIAQLEEKLAAARNKHGVLVQRHVHAEKRNKARTKIRFSETSDVFARFDSFENRIERMEADADLVDYGRKSTIEDEWDKLESDDEIEREMEELKKELTQGAEDTKEK